MSSNKKSKSLSDFKANYCTTIQKDDVSKGYVTVPVESYEHLSIIQQNLLSAIWFVSETLPNINPTDEATHTIDTLVYLSRQFGMHEECLGLDELLK